MKTVTEVLAALESKGTEQTRKIYRRHGATGEFFGVKVGDLKVIAKQIKGDQELALALYETGNVDAMYLAGIVADGRQMTKKQLNDWAKNASWSMVAEYSVPGVTVESPFARELAMKWIFEKNESVASSGWTTYSGVVATTADEDLDLEEIEGLLQKTESEISEAPDRIRYTMNGFVISVGGYVKPLSKQAKATAKKLGKVEVDMGETSCKVPLALEYIEKMERSGRAFKKRKTIKC
ncbi:DNA alkylation repair protein [Roseibacillus persicicus]|uniref:DNA alkylation repair protein n=1 Tax=Roseibacillus persicicus TaxID=454148 RepID=UPI00280E5139|nr:DNA alkylation repair protein [Roseibacillus persicicus]MDQ8189313.1 DNA alkylation repair protein [Roseibacillus persicicus]